MKRYNVLDAKEDLQYDTTNRSIDRVIAKLGKTINQLEVDKLEAYTAIDAADTQNMNSCTECGEWDNHKPNCIVNKAVNYIKENS